jgi:hypothetical protein
MDSFRTVCVNDYGGQLFRAALFSLAGINFFMEVITDEKFFPYSFTFNLLGQLGDRIRG